MTQWLDYAAAYGAPHSGTGTIKVLRQVQSPQLGNRRDLLVYLPPGAESSGRDYPVLYMQDGQNLFDRATSFAGEWGVDRTLDATAREGREAIVVGIPNMGEARIDEYSPFRDRRVGGGRGDAYVAFLADTVKPLVERDFPARTAAEHVTIAGSSMGGLISLYAFLERPDQFGSVAAMSPSLWFSRRAILSRAAALDAARGRIYVDIGTSEHANAVADVRALRDLLVARGYRRGHDLMFVLERGGRHHEQDWGRRLHKAIAFLIDAGAGE